MSLDRGASYRFVWRTCCFIVTVPERIWKKPQRRLFSNWKSIKSKCSASGINLPIKAMTTKHKPPHLLWREGNKFRDPLRIKHKRKWRKTKCRRVSARSSFLNSFLPENRNVQRTICRRKSWMRRISIEIRHRLEISQEHLSKEMSRDYTVRRTKHEPQTP